MKKLLYIILLLPLWVNAQTNGTIQKTSATGTIQGSFGSLGLDTLTRVTGALVNGYILKYHAATNKWYASPDPTYPGLQDSLTKKANRTFDNVASGSIAKSKVDTTSAGLQTVSNFFPKGDTRYAKGVGNAVLTTGNQTVAGDKTFTGYTTMSTAAGTPLVIGTASINKIQWKNEYGSSLGFIGASNNAFFRVGNIATGSDVWSIRTNGVVNVPGLAGAGDRVLYIDNAGDQGALTAGTGISISGGVITATGGTSGSVTTTGLTAAYLTKGSGASAVVNSVLVESGGNVNNTTGYLGAISGFWTPSLNTYMLPITEGWEVQSNSASVSRYGFKTSNAVLRGYVGANSTGVIGGFMDTGGTFKVYSDASGNWTAAGAGTFSGSATATNFIGPGTGLTGTASGLSIGGNAATSTLASNSTLWNGYNIGGSIASAIQYALVFDNVSGGYRLANASGLQGFLGLGSNAYTSTAYAPLASPALTGNPTAPTQSAGDNSTKIATTAYVDGAISAGTYLPFVTFTNPTGTVSPGFGAGMVNFVVHNGTTATMLLPAVVSTAVAGSVAYVKNRGSGNITIYSNAGDNDIYTTSAVNTYVITPGNSAIIAFDGTYFNVQ